MTAVVSALDEHTPTQIGEKGHQEYTWSTIVQEKILQLSYQLTRTQDETQLNKLNKIYGELIEQVFYITDPKEAIINYQGYIISLIPYVRDIISGKGEYNLYYNLVGTLAFTIENNREKVSPEQTHKMEELLCACVRCSVYLEGFDHASGSWKDMKYLLNHLWYVFGEKTLIKTRIFNYILGMCCDQLRLDAGNPSKGKSLSTMDSPRKIK